MKKRPEGEETTSRRMFAKSIAASLVTAPLASSLSCENKQDIVPDHFRHDPPPIIIMDGSFILNIDEDLEFEGEIGEDHPGGGGKKLKQYKRKQGGDIACVIVRKKKNGPILFCREFDKKDCRIEIYFDTKNCKKADGSKCDKA